MEANIGRSSAKVLTEHAVLVVSCFKQAPRPGIFTVLDLHKMDRECAEVVVVLDAHVQFCQSCTQSV